MASESRTGGTGSEQRELLSVGVPANASAIADVSDTVAKLLLSLGVPEEKQLEIGLALQEALANAVVHGCGNDPSKKVHCRLSSDNEGRIRIIVSDQGPGHDVAPLGAPSLMPDLHRDRGRGIYLIRQLMDDVRFERGGREIQMWKY